jgi:mannose-6-phosphate isomerase
MPDAKPVQRVFPLTGTVLEYAWGGAVFLAGLLGKNNAEGRPWAEYWMGVHPACPSVLDTPGGPIALDEFIKREPEFALGADVRERFGGLPFLFKVQDVAQTLSIQVHPNKEQARAGFQREEAAIIPRNASNRNYKDPNHKPEMLVALSEFWLLHGFREAELLIDILDSVPEFESLIPHFAGNNFEALYRHIYNMSQAEVNKFFQPLAERILPAYSEGRLRRTQPDFWAARAIETYCPSGDFDRGLFSVYFFNIVRLNPGEGLFQGAGLPHAYLEGQCMELMANSDNVIRAGLTPKHRDIPELLRLVHFEGIRPQVLRRSAGTCMAYGTPATEFALEHCRVPAGDRHFHYAESPSIIIVIEGEGQASGSGLNLPLRPGSAFFSTPGADLMLQARTAMSVYTAYVPGV